MTFKVKVELTIEPSESPFYLPRERELEYYLDTLKDTYNKLKKEYKKLKKNQGKITIQDYDKTANEMRKYYAKLREEEQSENVSDK